MAAYTKHDLSDINLRQQIVLDLYQELSTWEIPENHYLRWAPYALKGLMKENEKIEYFLDFKNSEIKDVYNDLENELLNKFGINQDQYTFDMPISIGNHILFETFQIDYHQVYNDHYDGIPADVFFASTSEKILKNLKKTEVFKNLPEETRFSEIGTSKNNVRINSSNTFSVINILHSKFISNRNSYFNLNRDQDLDSDYFERSMFDLYDFLKNFREDNLSNAAWNLEQHIEKILKKKVVIHLSNNNNNKIPSKYSNLIRKEHNLNGLIEIIQPLTNVNLQPLNIPIKPSVRYGMNIPARDILFSYFYKYIRVLNELTLHDHTFFDDLSICFSLGQEYKFRRLKHENKRNPKKQ